MYLNFTALVYIAVAYLIRSIGVKKLLGTLKSRVRDDGASSRRHKTNRGTR
jgi:hypothetical protein